MKSILSCCVLLASLVSALGQGDGTNLSIITQPQSQTVPLGLSVTFGVVVSGPGPFYYQWQLNGTNLPGDPAAGIITTVAGNGSTTYSGDGGLAIDAGLGGFPPLPPTVSVDKIGELFIADSQYNRIRRVDTNGIITTVAGNGTAGYSGDGGLAIFASLNRPRGVAVDGAGNLFIADSLNHCIRKVDANSIITTIAGNGTGGYSGDGFPATNANLNSPHGVALDGAGNLFIADYGNQRIRKVDTNGIITTVAGNGTSGYSGDGGTATNANIANPYSVAVDSFGNLMIADSANQRIRKVDTNDIITTIAGNGTNGYSGDGGAATNASLDSPQSVVVDAFNNVILADTLNQRVRLVNAQGIISTLAGIGTAGFSGDGGAATNASLSRPTGVAVDQLDNLFIADSSNHRIREVSLATGSPMLTISDVNSGNLGNYTVVIGNPFQTITSSVAVLQLGSRIFVNGQLAAGTVVSGVSAQVTMMGIFTNGFLFYTLDGTTPSFSSPLYSGPITLTNTATVQALNLSADFSQSVFATLVTVQIVPDFALTTSVVGGGTIGASPAGGPYPSNSVVVLTAAASANWAFDHWTGDVSGTQNPLTLTMNGPLSIQAVFVPTAYPLTVSTPGGGSVYVNGQTISPGTYYPMGSLVTVTASTDSGWSFLGWQGDATGTNNPLSVTMNQTDNVEALFGTLVGTQAVGGGSILLGQSNPVPYGTVVTLSAVPNSGNYFVTWSGAASGTISPTTITVTSATPTADALFTALPPGKCSLSAVVNGSGTVNISPQQSYYNPGDIVTLSASTSTPGFAFYGWSQGASGVSNPLTVIITTNTVVQANFVGLPSATISPQNPLVLAGSNVVLTANTTGLPPFSYQWEDSHGIITGATNASFTISNAQATNSDNYSVIVSNPLGSVTSVVATVTVVFPPSISVSPQPETVPAGSAASFSVIASGTGPLDYQWWNSAGSLPGASNASLTFTPAETNDWDNYFVVVSNAYGVATSSTAGLVVYVPVSIINPPVSEILPARSTAVFSVTAAGYPAPSYQWRFNGTNLPGATASSLSITNVQLSSLGDYTVLVDNGYSSESSMANLSMSPSITRPYVGATAIWGLSAQLSVGAIGTGQLSYQWFQDGAAIAGATNADFSLANVQFTNAGLYSVVISSVLGSVTNTPALLVVNPSGVSFGLCPLITITGVVGYTYTIQSTADLSNTNSWVTWTNVTLTSPIQLLADTNTDATLPGNPRRFYRVIPGP